MEHTELRKYSAIHGCPADPRGKVAQRTCYLPFEMRNAPKLTGNKAS